MRQAHTMDEVADTARSLSLDAYLCALLSPRSARSDLIALAAFTGEVARIPTLVSEPMLGEIRLQWWRDAISAATKGALSGHAVMDALMPGLRDGRINSALLTGIVDARSFDLAAKPIEDLGALEVYLAKTTGAHLQLAAQIISTTLSGDVASDSVKSCAAASRAAGIAVGLADLLANLPCYAALGANPIPPEMAHEGFQSTAEDLHKAVRALAAHARAHVSEVSTRHLPGPVRCAFLPLALVEPKLHAATDAGRAPLTQVATINPAIRVWRLTRARIGGF